MPFGLSLPGRGAKADEKHEPSLDEILPHSNQRIDLILLVAICADHMQDGLAATFETQHANRGPSEAVGQGDQDGQGGAEDQSSLMNVQWAKLEDLSSSRMRHLKSAAIGSLKDWRNDVLDRMGKAMEVKVEAVKDAHAQYKSKHEGSTEDKGGYATDQPVNNGLPFHTVLLPTSLQPLDKKDRALILGAVLFMLLSLEHYSAHSRVLMAYLCQNFDLPYDVLGSQETTTAATLLDAASKSDKIDAEDARKKQADEGSTARKWKIGLATVAGAALVGVTGGLAAPLVIGVAGTIMGGIGLGGLATLLGATILNPITIGALFGALGGKMTGTAMTNYAKEVQDFAFMPVSETKPHSPAVEQAGSPEDSKVPSHKLRVAIGVSGWVTKESDVTLPWRIFSTATTEPFALRYELEAVTAFSSALYSILSNGAYGLAQSYAIGLVLPALSAALAPLGLIKARKLIDNPFSIALERSEKAGKVMAHALMDKCQGERPVTLVGFSIGGRVIYSCLEELAAKKAFGLIENAILIGSPVPSSELAWRRMRSVVAGRLINVYSQKDMLLGFMYRARNIQLGIAGLQAITAPGIENLDVSEIVNGHNQYRLAVGRILEDLKFADLDHDQLAQEKAELENQKTHEKEVYEEAKRKGELKDLEDENGQIKMADSSQADGGTTEPSQVEEKDAGKRAKMNEQLEKMHITKHS